MTEINRKILFSIFAILGDVVSWLSKAISNFTVTSAGADVINLQKLP